MTSLLPDLHIVKDYLTWQHAIYGGDATVELHQYLARVGTPRPSLEDALRAVDRLLFDVTDNTYEQEEGKP